MNREQIERLAMDSAAGELNEDAEALLKEYFSEHDQEKKWAQDISELYKMTSKTIDTITAERNQKSSKVTSQKTAWKLNSSAVARWAAAIVVFTSIGAGLGRWSKQTEPISEPVKITISNHSQRVPHVDLVVVPSEGFWRDKAMAMLEPKSVIHSEKRMQIDHLWQQYKEYIKEKRND
ncbi:MAG: hypothetical protein ACYSUK_06585 [Planctomycetota bacterium]|jgi:hypothetical protein